MTAAVYQIFILSHFIASNCLTFWARNEIRKVRISIPQLLINSRYLVISCDDNNGVFWKGLELSYVFFFIKYTWKMVFVLSSMCSATLRILIQNSRKTWLLKPFDLTFYTFWLDLTWWHGYRILRKPCNHIGPSQITAWGARLRFLVKQKM